MCDVGVDQAHATELPAVFVTFHGVDTDRVGGLVHEGAVSDGKHVATQAGADSGWRGGQIHSFIHSFVH